MAEKGSKAKEAKSKSSDKEPKDAKGAEGQFIDGYKVPGSHMFHMGELRFIHISKFKYLVLVALKEFTKPAQMKSLKPGKAAISLTAKQWHIMTGKLKGEIDAAIKSLEKSDEPSPKKQKTGKDAAKSAAAETKMQLSDNRRVTVRHGEMDGKSQVVIEVREYTMEKGKEKAPTDKGIVLSATQWDGLKSQITAVDKDLEENFGAIRKDE